MKHTGGQKIMTANEAIEILREQMDDANDCKKILVEQMKPCKEVAQSVKHWESVMDALKMGIGAIELCEKAKERS